MRDGELFGQIQHYVAQVRAGKMSPEELVDQAEAATLYAQAPSKKRGFSLGTFELGYMRDSWSWFIDLSTYRYVKFVGFSRGRFFVGMIFGTATPATEEAREKRLHELDEKRRAK